MINKFIQVGSYPSKVEPELGEVMEFLLASLGSNLLSYLLISDDSGTTVSEENLAVVERRLRAAYELFKEAQEVDSPDTVRAWFAGMNDSLNGMSALRALREGRFDEVEEAVHDFIAIG